MKNLLFVFALLTVTLASKAQHYGDSLYQRLAPITNLEDAQLDTGNVIKLVLKRNKFTSIPASIFNFTEIEYLDLSKNRIDTISDDIAKLTNLRVLNLSKNKITTIPPAIYKLKKLESLIIGGNEFSILPSGIDSLQSLVEISLWNTNVDILPFGIEKIKTLRVIDMRGILMNPPQQDEIYDLLPEDIKIYLSPPCNCSF